MEDGEWGCPIPIVSKDKGNGAILYLPDLSLPSPFRRGKDKRAGIASTLFQSAHITSVNAIYSGSKNHKKRSGATETNVVVDVVRSVVVPIRRTHVVIVVVPRAAPQHALWRPHRITRFSTSRRVIFQFRSGTLPHKDIVDDWSIFYDEQGEDTNAVCPVPDRLAVKACVYPAL